MRNKWILLGLLSCLITIPAAAQESVPRLEVSGDYSYLRFSPTTSREIPHRSLNGGGASVNVNLIKNFGVKAEVMGYESTRWITTFAAPLVTSQGTIPVGTYHSQGNMFTYLFGPTYTHRTDFANVFGEVLFGGSRTNGYAEWAKAINAGGGNIGTIVVQNPFTMAIGGGVDINVTPKIAFRLFEGDYVMTRYNNALSFGTHQNNFRFVTGFVFRFGGE